MILYCHRCYMNTNWDGAENISGKDFILAQQVVESAWGFGDLVYVGF